MNHSLSKQVAFWACNLVAGVSLPLLLVLLCSGQAAAQGNANTSMVNPPRLTQIATQIGVDAYPLNQWDDAASAVKIQQQITAMQPSILDGTATPNMVSRFNYFSRVHRDIVQYSMAVEVAMLQDIMETYYASKSQMPKSQLPIAYNQLVSIL